MRTFILIDRPVKIYHIFTAGSLGLCIDITGNETLQLPRPFHCSQCRTGCRVLRRIIQHLFLIKLKEKLGTRIIEGAGKDLFRRISILRLDIIGFIRILYTYKTAFLHHTGAADGHRVSALIKNFPQF